MTKVIFMTALILGCSFYAAAQTTPVKATSKGEQKTQKKGTATTDKKTTVLKSASTNEAHGPLSFPMPKADIDTASLPAVKNQQKK